MKLSARLEKILDMIGTDAGVLADIGTDHAYIPIEAVKRGMAERAIACDIAEGPLKIAGENVAAEGLTGIIELCIADGLGGIAPGSADTIVIAGMGGALMSRILTQGHETAYLAKTLILSPQSDFSMFRGTLLRLGFGTVSETCVFDEGKYYFIIKAKPGMAAPGYTDFELEYGRGSLFDEAGAQARAEYINNQLKTYRTIAAVLEAESAPAANRRKEELSKLIRDIEGGLK